MSWKFFRGRRDPQYNEIPDRMKAYDKSGDRSVVHIRLDDQTVLLLNQLKLATGLEMQRMVAFAVSELIRQHPELRTIVKHFLKKSTHELVTLFISIGRGLLLVLPNRYPIGRRGR